MFAPSPPAGGCFLPNPSVFRVWRPSCAQSALPGAAHGRVVSATPKDRRTARRLPVGWFPRHLRTAGQLDVSRCPEQRPAGQRLAEPGHCEHLRRPPRAPNQWLKKTSSATQPSLLPCPISLWLALPQISQTPSDRGW